jgi:sulfur relay (sulfurtransferase) complex TusBCD TusD component (DsrE family)
MKRLLLILSLSLFIGSAAFSQTKSTCADFSYLSKDVAPDLGIVLYSADAETIWNAFRLANLARTKGDVVMIFLLGKGIDGFRSDDVRFDIAKESQNFVANGGQILACATCVKMRGTEEVNKCTVSSIFDLYQIVNKSKRLLTF